jgi:aminobenzoyl-glutamate transport protein
MTNDAPAPRRGPLAIFLDIIETVGNRLPDPTVIFLLGALLVMALSHVGEMGGWSVDKPVASPKMVEVLDSGTGQPIEVRSLTPRGRSQVLATDAEGQPRITTVREPIVLAPDEEHPTHRLIIEETTVPVRAVSLLDRDGFAWVMNNLVENFTGFHPLGIVLVAMLGIGVAEKTGLISVLLRMLMIVTPMSLLNPAMILIGILANVAADAGYVVLPPLAAALYKAVGRSPLVGIAAVFAGISAGFSANLIITSLDPLLSGLAQEGAQILDPTYTVVPTANYYFMIVSTFVLTGVGWFVTSRFIEPRFDAKPADEGGPAPLTAEDRDARNISPGEVRALKLAGVVHFVALALCLALILVPGAPLNGLDAAGAPRWSNSIVPMLLIVFLAPAIAFGVREGTLEQETGTTRVDIGVARLMARSMADMGPYIVLAFFAAQFVEFFNHSNLGVMLAIVGGEFLASIDMPAWALMAAFIVVAMLGNLFIGSASAKFAFFAPVFIPMFMQAGISPELTMAAYRVGDSCTNIITPLMPYFVIILVFMQKYAPKSGIGTLTAMMLPYSIAFWIVWTLLLIAWTISGIPLGIGGPLHYPN